MARWSAILLLGLLLAACASVEGESVELPRADRAQDADTIGQSLQLTYRVIANRGEGGCRIGTIGEATEAACYEAEIQLASDVALDLAGSTIRFSQVDPVDLVDTSGGGQIAHLNGDLHELSFAPGSGIIDPGAPLNIAFTVNGLALTRAKFMPNYYVVDRAGNTSLIQSTREQPQSAMGRKALPFLAPLPDDLRRAQRDLTRIETPQVTFELNRGVEFVPGAVDSGIVPNPAHVTLAENAARIDLARGVAPSVVGADIASLQAALTRLKLLGVSTTADGLPIRVRVDETLAIPAEGYELSARPEAIAVRASDAAGAFYAIQSLAALIRPGALDIPAIEIEDAPRFPFRGMHFDIARNFHGPETIRALIDQMAAYKLNKLHLHLADDEGWRLEIAGLPELTEIGSKRCHDPQERHCLLPQLGSGPGTENSGSGYLSEEDYVAILQYAAARHIEVVPALDMPGHARAAVKAMEERYQRLIEEGAGEAEASRYLLSDFEDQTSYSSIQHYSDNTINVCRPSAYRFVEHVLDRLIALHEDAGVLLNRYHIGADETAGAWSESPSCKSFLASGEGPNSAGELGGFFVARVAQMVSDRGVLPAAWSDGLSHADADLLPEQVQSNIWATLAGGANTIANDHANRGWDVVISLPDATYFDLPYAAHPDEGGYYWAIRRAPTRKLFSMMPENLPAMAAYWKDRDDQPFVIDDRPSESGNVHNPLESGRKFTGLQGHLWTETVRDRETLGYQIFPRLLALAERSWSRAAWEIPYDHAGRLVTRGDARHSEDIVAAMQSDWNRFSSILAAKELKKLELGGWSYRLPAAGVTLADGRLQANSAIAGLPIECDRGGGWRPFSVCETASSNGPVRLRVTNPSGDRNGREQLAFPSR